jgi:hypothetical protein
MFVQLALATSQQVLSCMLQYVVVCLYEFLEQRGSGAGLMVHAAGW